jgi:uncharacterized BrkB/YihY/UPF0761 family membrane protein
MADSLDMLVFGIFLWVWAAVVFSSRNLLARTAARIYKPSDYEKFFRQQMVAFSVGCGVVVVLGLILIVWGLAEFLQQ